MTLFTLILFTHVLGAIVAFGPAFTFPIIGAAGGRERMHGNFSTRLSSRISKIQVVPFALLQGVTGVGLMLTGSFDLTKALWLDVAIVLYLVAIGYALLVQTPTVQKVIALTTPPADAVPGPPPAGGPPAGGPPPELMGLVQRVQRGGMLLMVLVISIVFLMVTKPF